MAKRVRFKLSDLSDEQLLELFESVPSDGELSSISSDDEDDDFNVVEALTDALEDADTVSFIDSNAENVPNNSQEPKPSRKTRKRPLLPLPIIEDSACIPLPTSGGFDVLLFCYFFNAEIMKIIVDETMRAALTDNITNKFKINKDDIHHYIGILMYMSIYRYPNLKSYWAKNAFELIQTCMPRSRFEAIKKYFSLSDESEWIKKGEQGYDPLFRTRKLVDCLNQRADNTFTIISDNAVSTLSPISTATTQARPEC
ncbi:hypothetical protein ACLKA6_020022 [Drosophila palustris]